MTSNGLAYHAEKFRRAVEANDFSLAQTTLQKYVVCFRSRTRTLAEIESARDLLRWGIGATKANRTQIASELMLLKRVFDAYGPPKRNHTWRLEA
jgi:hypothetical protein